VRTELVSNMSILYENRGPVALCVNDAVITEIDRIGLLPKVEAVETIVVWTYEGDLGGKMTPLVAFVEGV
jgi:hypothetical protein